MEELFCVSVCLSDLNAPKRILQKQQQNYYYFYLSKKKIHGAAKKISSADVISEGIFY